MKTGDSSLASIEQLTFEFKAPTISDEKHREWLSEWLNIFRLFTP